MAKIRKGHDLFAYSYQSTIAAKTTAGTAAGTDRLINLRDGEENLPLLSLRCIEKKRQLGSSTSASSNATGSGQSMARAVAIVVFPFLPFRWQPLWSFMSRRPRSLDFRKISREKGLKSGSNICLLGTEDTNTGLFQDIPGIGPDLS